MTPIDVLSEIQKLPLSDARQVARQLADYLREREASGHTGDRQERSEDEFERYLLAKGVASHVATRDDTDEEFNDFGLIEVEGEPLSETILRERR